MAINKNHEFEELNGTRCAIVEKNVSVARLEFLSKLLGFNNYTVVAIPSPPPKVAPAPVTEAAVPVDSPAMDTPIVPETYTLGVTDVMFNPTNAIFGRLLKTADGHIVTLAYWNQKEIIAKDEIPYFENII